MNKYRIHWNKTESLTTWADSTTEAVILAVGERIQDGLPFEIHFVELKTEGNCWELVHGEVNIKY